MADDPTAGGDGAMPPLALGGFGSFYAGGRQIAVAGRPVTEIRFTADTPPVPFDPNGTYRVEQAYVQYFVPATRRPGWPPVLLLHGGGMTGAMWETTPDGRPGWLHGLLARGLAVYAMDQAERGRAGFNATPEPWPGHPLTRTGEEAWTLFRFGPAGSFADRAAFPGCRFPVAAFDRFMAQFVPRWTGTAAMQTAALRAVLAEVGQRDAPPLLICHSQGGEAAFAALAAAPSALAGLVALEPSGFPADPFPVALPRDFPALIVSGDRLDMDDLWRALDGRMDSAAVLLAASGAQAERLKLPRAGLPGATHMMMMDACSDAALDRVMDRLGGVFG